MKQSIHAIVTCIFCGILATSTSLSAKTLVGLEFDGTSAIDKSGPLDKYVADIQQQLPDKFEYEVFNAPRGVKLFFEKKRDCLIPASDYLPYYQNLNIHFSNPFAVVSYTAFSYTETPFTNKDDLQGKVIGIIRGFDSWDIQARLNLVNTQFVRVTTLNALVKLLEARRVDVVLHDNQDFVAALQRENIALPNFNEQAPIFRDSLTIACHATKENSQLIKSINPIIVKLAKAKTLPTYYYQRQ